MATCDLMYTEPSALCGTGLIPTELVTCAPFKGGGSEWRYAATVYRLAVDENLAVNGTVTAWMLRAFT